MVVSMVKSIRQAARNQSTQEVLARRFAAMEVRANAEREGQEIARRRVYDEALVPFSEVFSRLKNVDLAELADIGDLVEADLPDVELREVRLNAVGAMGALVGGVAAGAGIGALAYTAVGAFAAASTGTAISTLSGAAATSATLAWLGGGSLAAGGGGVAAGTMVLTGIVALPIVVSLAGFVEWRGRKALSQQDEVQAELAKVAAELDRVEVSADEVCARSRAIRHLLDDARAALVERVPALRRLLEEEDDYTRLTQAERTQVGTMVSLATTVVAVMSARIADDEGQVTDLSERVVTDARARLSLLAGVR
ncbi:hypothetical protein [Sphaerisporangium sp. NPDC051011]|uniref:hypothetical protein n=1 Tax=Sphaerisporangium sp. NPDC051011 TaxID=3155792 RepID=UPI0033D72907